jgi:predicted Rossmann fold nucleotide-binding protein DprA/Smf involved in DNA uptake
MKIAIIGTRDPTEEQEFKGGYLAERLSMAGHRIATGAAPGIDAAAMRGAMTGQLDVFLPWPSFSAALIPRHAKRTVFSEVLHADWMKSVEEFHPAPRSLTPAARRLHARNYGIVEGAAIVVALPQRGEGGGTGQGIRIARGLKIPVLVQDAKISQLNDPEHVLHLIEDLLKGQLTLPPFTPSFVS